MRSLVQRVLLLRAFAEVRVVTVTIGAMFALLSLRAVIEPVSDPDVWWVAAVGRDTVLRGHLPRLNGYSFVDASVPWVMHEWLLAAPYALGLSHLGPAFFALLGVLSGAATLTLVLANTAGRSRHLPGGAWLTLLTLFGCREALVSPRPGYVALSFAAAAVWLSFRSDFSRLHAALTVALALVWSNAHGSFPLGLGLFALGAWDARDRSFRRLWTLGATMTASLATPYGVRLHGLVARYLLGGDPAIALVHDNIAEFAPLWRAQWPFVNPQNSLALALLTVLALWSLRGPSKARGVAALGVLGLAVLHARHIVLAVVVAASVLAPALDDVLDRVLDAPAPRLRFRPWMAVLPGLAAALLTASALDRHRSRAAWISDRLGGASLVALTARIPDGARVYAPFEASGLILWVAGARRVRVLMDPRNDCFRASTLALGFGLERGTLTGAELDAAMANTGTERIVSPTDHLAARWAVARGWRLDAREGRWGLWVRSPASGTAPPSQD